jgi:hypothetical protein
VGGASTSGGALAAHGGVEADVRTSERRSHSALGKLLMAVVAAYTPVPVTLPPAEPYRNPNGTVGEGWVRPLLQTLAFIVAQPRSSAGAPQ